MLAFARGLLFDPAAASTSAPVSPSQAISCHWILTTSPSPRSHGPHVREPPLAASRRRRSRADRDHSDPPSPAPPSRSGKLLCSSMRSSAREIVASFAASPAATVAVARLPYGVTHRVQASGWSHRDNGTRTGCRAEPHGFLRFPSPRSAAGAAYPQPARNIVVGRASDRHPVLTRLARRA